MTESVVVIGAGGHGREVFSFLEDDLRNGRHDNLEIVGFLDDHEPDHQLLERIGAAWLGPVSTMTQLPPNTRYIIGIGDGRIRQRLDAEVTSQGFEPLTVVSRDARVGRDVTLAPGVVIFPFATVTTNVSLGRHTHVGRGAAVGHDSVVGDYVSIFPLAAVSGTVRIGSMVTVGSQASIKQGHRVGEGATIGMGAAVVSDVAPNITVVGVPAREQRRSGGPEAR